MLISTRTRSGDVRALAGAIVLGSSAGLVIGAAYLATGGLKPGAPSAPAPAGSGPLQASSAPVDHTGGARPKAISIAVATTMPRPASVQSDLALRDRFRVAVQAFRATAQPFRFQQVADAPSDLHCLTEAVYFEARGESAAGQQAVAQVVLNRVRHPSFPKTICAVVHQHTGSGCQFSFACSSRQSPVESVAWRRAEAIASSEMHGAVMAVVGDATQFQAARASPFAGLLKVAQVGAHIFYRLGGRAGSPAMFHQTPSASGDAGKVELARLETAPGFRALQNVSAGDGRIKVTLYPSSASPPVAAVKAETPALKLVAAMTPDRKVAPEVPVHAALAPASTSTSTKPDEAPAGKPASLTLALAQS